MRPSFSCPGCLNDCFPPGAAPAPRGSCNGSAGRDGVFSKEAIDIYRANVAAPGAASAMLNWYRAAGRDILAAEDLEAPIDAPTLVIWGMQDVALGEFCLEGTECYVRDLRIERLPSVSHWTPEDAPEKVNELIVGFA